MARGSNAPAWSIQVPPGFTHWASRVLNPETLAVIRGDTEQCLAVLGAFVYALRHPDLDGTNAAMIPESVKARKRRAKHDH